MNNSQRIQFKQFSFLVLCHSLPFLLCCSTEGGGVATFMANPYAPRNEWLSLTMNEPGSLSFSTAMAVQPRGKKHRQAKVRIITFTLYKPTRAYYLSAVQNQYLPWSLEMSGLYQNLEVSCTNFTVSCFPPKSARHRWRFCVRFQTGFVTKQQRKIKLERLVKGQCTQTTNRRIITLISNHTDLLDFLSF